MSAPSPFYGGPRLPRARGCVMFGFGHLERGRLSVVLPLSLFLCLCLCLTLSLSLFELRTCVGGGGGAWGWIERVLMKAGICSTKIS